MSVLIGNGANVKGFYIMKNKYKDNKKCVFNLPVFKFNKHGKVKTYTVKFMLPIGENKIKSSFKRTEEGYKHTDLLFTNTDGILNKNVITTAKDCDGIHYFNDNFQLVGGKWVNIK
jgi:hypothetical protein